LNNLKIQKKANRHVALRYGDYDGLSLDYYYFDKAPTTPTQDPKLLYATMQEESESLSDNDFKEWVQWCIYSSCQFTYEEVSKHLSLANSLNARPIITSQFESDLLQLKSSARNESLESTVTDSLLNLELPFVDKIDPEKLMRIRRKDNKAFVAFRNKMNSYFHAARYTDNKEELRRINEAFSHDVIEVELPLLKKQIRYAGIRFLLGMGGTSFGLMANFQQNNLGFVALSALAISAIGAGVELKSAKDTNSFYFLYKALK
jgi:hypothetical protein